MTAALIRKLRRWDRVSDEECAVLAQAAGPTRRLRAGEEVVAEGDRPTESTLLVEGLCARFNAFPDGRRQITALHVSGDFVDLHSFLLKTMDHGIVALTACAVVGVKHTALEAVTDRFPHLTRLLWLNTLIDGAIHRQWLVSMGRRSARGQFAHIVCELALRYKTVGLGDERRFPLPLVQAEFADVLGLSPVHINRVLQELRGDALIDWRGGEIQILDWPRLVEVAEFDPTYLRLTAEPT